MKTIVRMTIMVLAVALLAVMACEPERSPIDPAETKVPGVTDTEVLIGSSLALSGHAGYLGTQTLRGAMSYINHVNEQGGVHGRKIKVVFHDDQYDPPLCVGNTHKLIVDQGVFALFCYVGTPTTVKIIPLVNKAKIPLLGMFTGANALREPMSRYIINVRASYYQETEEAVRRFVKDLGFSKIAVFYQYDDYGFDGLKGAELTLKKFELAPVATGTYIRGTLDVEDGLKKIAESQAEAVVMIGTYEPCAKFINMALENGFSPVFYNVSFVGAEELARRLGGRGENVFVTQVVPPPQSPESRTLLWGAGEYIDLLEKYFLEEKPNAVGLEGYINARVLVEGLRRAGRNLDRERFIDAVESIRNFSLGIANTLSFGPTDHQGLERVYFTRFKDGGFKLVTDWGRVKQDLQVQNSRSPDASE